jgi:glycosyltransferase involved in cell wall biosynthesis
MTKNNNHIAYFCPSLSWGGLEMNQLRNAEWMHNRGHQVIIFVQEESKIHQEAKSLGIAVDFVGSHKKYYDFVKASKLIKKIKKHKITHLIVRDPKDMSICALAKSWSIKKFFLAYFMEMQIGIPKRDLLHSLRYSSYDLWSCPLPWLKQQVNELTKFPEKKTVVIPSGLELDKYFNAPNSQVAKQMLELNINKNYIGLVGRFDEQKRQLLLLESFNDIKDKISHDLVFLGESTHGESDDYFDKLKAFVKQNNIENRVHFRPFRSDVETFYAAIDVFVMVTKSETFGMVTIEAMASGCKVVGSNKGGTVEILNHGEFGELFESGNAIDLSNKLLIAISNQNFDANVIKNEAARYDAKIVCNKVESALGL